MMFSRTRTTTIALCLTVAVLLNGMAVDVQGELTDKPWGQVAHSRVGLPTISDYCKGANREMATANRVELLEDGEELSKMTCEAAGYCWDFDRSSKPGLSPCYAPQALLAYRGHTCKVPEKQRVRQRAYSGGWVQCHGVNGCYEAGPRHAPYCFHPKIWHNDDVDDRATDNEYCKGRTFRAWSSDAPGDGNDTKEGCESNGNCWDPARKIHMGGHRGKCFTPYADATSCAIPEDQRVRAAWRGPQQRTTRWFCKDLMGHCFDEKPDGTSLCYHANIKAILQAPKDAAAKWREAYKAERERIYNTGHVP